MTTFDTQIQCEDIYYDEEIIQPGEDYERYLSWTKRPIGQCRHPCVEKDSDS